MGSVQTSGSNCGPTCARTQGCTHFSWTNYNGGTCWMKRDAVTKSDAFYSSTPGIVCGVV